MTTGLTDAAFGKSDGQLLALTKGACVQLLSPSLFPVWGTTEQYQPEGQNIHFASKARTNSCKLQRTILQRPVLETLNMSASIGPFWRTDFDGSSCYSAPISTAEYSCLPPCFFDDPPEVAVQLLRHT